MTGPRILIAGIGNVFFGDDGFGVEVARRLAVRPQPDNVRVVDFGIRGLDLAYTMTDGFDWAILVDAVPRGKAPGTLCVLEPEIDSTVGAEVIETHGMNPMRVLRLASSLGGPLPAVRIVGCEPGALGSEEEPVMGLSEPVAAAVDDAIGLIDALVGEFNRATIVAAGGI